MNLLNRKGKADAPLLGYASGGSRCDSALSNGSDQSVSSSENNNYGADKTVVDIDNLVERWVYYMWEKTKKGRLEMEDVQIIIDWSKVELDQDDAKFENNLNYSSREPVGQTLFSTYFTNKTDQDQEYSFKTERKTRQSCSFSFEKAFSSEKEKGLSIKLPQDIIEIGGGIKCIQSISCGKDSTIEEEIIWGVDSLIKVKPKFKVCASLNITEVKLERSFTINTYMRGRIFVKILNRKETNVIVKTFSAEIVEIIQLALDRNWISSHACKFEIIDINDNKKVKINLVGKCKFRIGVEQHVTLEEYSLDKL